MKSRQLEGLDRSIGLKTVKRDLEIFIGLFRQQFKPGEIEELHKIIKQLDYAIAINERIMLAQAIYRNQNPNLSYLPDDNPIRKEFLSMLADIAYDISNDIAGLAEGDSMILPGGYTNLEGGHTVLNKITKENQTQHTFTVVNTGAGVAEFESAFSLLKSVLQGAFQGELKFPDYQVNDLKLEEICNTEFHLDILRVAIDPIPGSNTKTMFEPIIKHLAKGDIKKLTKGQEHGIQTNGTCSRSCVETWLEGSLNNTLFKTFELFSMLIGLRDLKEVQKNPENQAVIDKLQADWRGIMVSEQLKGKDVLATLINLGSKNAMEAKNHLAELLKSKNVELERYKNEVKYDASFADANKRLRSLRKKENPQAFFDYDAKLGQKVEGLKSAYCQAAGQDASKEPSSPGLFAKKDLTQKWANYTAKKSKREKLLNKVRTNPLFYTNTRSEIAKIEGEIQSLERKKQVIDKESHNIKRCEYILAYITK